MTAYTIPTRRIPGLEALLRMSDSEIQKLENIFKELPRGLRIDEIISRLASGEVFTESNADEVVGVFVDLYSIKSENETDFDELVDGIIDALEQMDDDALKPEKGDWNKFKSHLKLLLSHDSTLGMSFKASRLWAQNERTFVEANIYSDIRPAFGSDIKDGFDTAVIIHNLQIQYHKGRDYDDITIALDCEDIRTFQKLFNRAEQKGKAIRSQLKDRIKILTPPTP